MPHLLGKNAKERPKKKQQRNFGAKQGVPNGPLLFQYQGGHGSFTERCEQFHFSVPSACGRCFSRTSTERHGSCFACKSGSRGSGSCFPFLEKGPTIPVETFRAPTGPFQPEHQTPAEPLQDLIRSKLGQNQVRIRSRRRGSLKGAL